VNGHQDSAVPGPPGAQVPNCGPSQLTTVALTQWAALPSARSELGKRPARWSPTPRRREAEATIACRMEVAGSGLMTTRGELPRGAESERTSGDAPVGAFGAAPSKAPPPGEEDHDVLFIPRGLNAHAGPARRALPFGHAGKAPAGVASAWRRVQEICLAPPRFFPAMPIGSDHGLGDPIDTVDAEQRGIDILITKPFQMRDTREGLGRILASPR
jgi:hypothetical protein